MGASDDVGGPSTCTSYIHLAPKAPDAQEIRWHAQTSADDARERAWTCSIHHRDVEYTWCERGGVAFLRRRRSNGALHETARDTPAEVERLWKLLLAGAAR